MLLSSSLALIVLGVVVWLFGTRLWLVAAGAGALLGIGLLQRFPGMADGFMGLVIVGGLAILLGVLGITAKAFAKTFGLVIGFIAGGGVVMGFIDMLAIDLGFMDWILALIGGGIGALLFARFFDWGLIVFASLVGSMLVVRGMMIGYFPTLAGGLGTVLILALTALGVYYHHRQRTGTPGVSSTSTGVTPSSADTGTP
jgi:hypothetical protein